MQVSHLGEKRIGQISALTRTLPPPRARKPAEARPHKNTVADRNRDKASIFSDNIARFQASTVTGTCPGFVSNTSRLRVSAAAKRV